MKYIYQALTTFLLEESKKDIPKSLSALDLKMIAMESDAAEFSKGGLTNDVLKLGGTANTAQLLKLVLLAAISSPRAMDFIGRMPDLSIQTQNLLKEWIVEVHERPMDHLISSANQSQLGESPEDDPNGVDECRNGVSPKISTDQGLVFEERMGRLMAENDKLKKDNDELRLAFDNLEDRLEHSQVNNVSQVPLLQAEALLIYKNSPLYSIDCPKRKTVYVRTTPRKTQSGRISFLNPKCTC